MKKGFFIAFEGIDGTGKTTQIRLLADSLTALGEEVLITKTPGDRVPYGSDGQSAVVGSSIGYHVRQLLFKDPTTHSMKPGVSDCLFLADIVQLQTEVIRPALRAGKVVLCDRYLESQYAYTVGKGTPDWANLAFHKAITTLPKITVLLVGDAAALVGRTKRAGTHEEGKQAGKIWETHETQTCIQDAYLARLGARHRNGVLVISDVHKRSINDIAQEIFDLVRDKLILARANPESQAELFEEAEA